MKKNIILFAFSLFLLGGCSRGELPTTNNQETGTAWTEDEKIYMQNAIGKVFVWINHILYYLAQILIAVSALFLVI